MRRIVAGLFISLDGVVETPERWHFPYFNPEMSEAVEAQMADSDTMLLGRVTYEGFAAYWPGQGNDNTTARYMNDVPKLVVSTTLASVEWRNSRLIRGDVGRALTAIRQEPGKNISVTGSVTLVRSLLREGLLDQLRLLVHPVVVGGGMRLFGDDGKHLPLTLVDSKTFSTGVLAVTYEPAQR